VQQGSAIISSAYKAEVPENNPLTMKPCIRKIHLARISKKCYTYVTLFGGFMPTAKKRINLAVDDSLYDELEKLKEIKGAPSLSSIVLELTKEALELQEDLYFAKIAAERDGDEIIPHESVWKKK
jgi:hypothetical protein